MTTSTILPHGTPADNVEVQSPPEYTPSWEQTRDALPGWLRLRADRLTRRAMLAPNVRETLRLLALADKAREAADWYAGKNGGAR